jgi:hypothetical protein
MITINESLLLVLLFFYLLFNAGGSILLGLWGTKKEDYYGAIDVIAGVITLFLLLIVTLL